MGERHYARRLVWLNRLDDAERYFSNALRRERRRGCGDARGGAAGTRLGESGEGRLRGGPRSTRPGFPVHPDSAARAHGAREPGF